MFDVAAGIPRLGTESAFRVLARAGQLEAAGPLDHQPGDRPAGLPDPGHIVEAGIKALRDGHHGYTPAGRHPGAAPGGLAADLVTAALGSRSTPARC